MILAQGFERTCAAMAKLFGYPVRTAFFPGVVMTTPEDAFRDYTLGPVLTGIVRGLTVDEQDAVTAAGGGASSEPAPEMIVMRGTIDEVQERFHHEGWTDGLPVIPPTIERVNDFLRFTDRPPHEVIGVLDPAGRQSTPWNVAANGVMAGCKPEYMPILIAIAEALSDPEWQLRNAGGTPGWEPLVVVSGRFVDELDFNYLQGALRAGRRANSTVGRFLRMYMRNVGGLRPPPGQVDGVTDKGTFGLNFNVALAENDQAVSQLGWPPYRVDRGFKPADNVVTLLSMAGISHPIYTGGATAEEHLESIAKIFTETIGRWVMTGLIYNRFNPILIISPNIAGVMAQSGYDKAKIRKYLYENCWVRAGDAIKFAHEIGTTDFDLERYVSDGLPAHYIESNDPDRMIRICLREEWTEIVVSGDPDRNQSRVYVPHCFGAPQSRLVRFPEGWQTLRSSAVTPVDYR